jgi:hypothetical protein
MNNQEEKRRNKRKKITSIILDAIAVASGLGIIGWIITDFFGGMIISLLSYPIIFLPIIILYIISFFNFIFSLIINRKQTSKIRTWSHSIVLMAILLFNTYDLEIFRSKKVLTAILKDDQCSHHLIFRKNGSVENTLYGMFGYKQVYTGSYIMKGDTIIFTKVPYDNDFIPDTLLRDDKQSALFMDKDSTGHFITEKEWLNHFDIE